MNNHAKVAVIGLDSAVPELVFERFRDDLPNLNALMEKGIWGPLQSTNPPITVPAWASMMSGRDPGQLGIYGFRNRRDHSYDRYGIADSRSVAVDRVWDVLSRAGKRVILQGVPLTYPIKPVNGYVVSDFLTPSTESPYTYPADLKSEVEHVSDGYVLDVEEFRTDNKVALLTRVHDTTRKHFAVAKHLLRTKPWDFFMMVGIAMDRIHHGFWNHMDPTHRHYQKGNPFETAIREYYRSVDEDIGEMVALLPPETAVFVVSDHGAKKLSGAVCFNEWLIREGYLTVKSYPAKPTPIDRVGIDWGRTKAWGDGGYYGRLFLNVRGRELNGTIDRRDYEKVREELIQKIAAIPSPEGQPLGSKAYRPEDLYPVLNGVPPDLLVYFGDLTWRSVGSIGLQSLHTFENDTGPDGANHDWNGIMIARVPDLLKQQELDDRLRQRQICEIGPAILHLFGLEFPPSRR